MEGWRFHKSKMMQPCWYHSQLWQDLHHQKSEDNRLSYCFVCWVFFFPPLHYVYESTAGTDIFLSVWKPQGFSTPCRGKEETNNGYFLWTLPLNTSPARNKRLERTEISTIWTTVLSHCLQFIFFSFTRYGGKGIQKVLHFFRPGKERSKHASCRRVGTNSSATPFIHSEVLTQITQQSKLYCLKYLLVAKFLYVFNWFYKKMFSLWLKS